MCFVFFKLYFIFTFLIDEPSVGLASKFSSKSINRVSFFVRWLLLCFFLFIFFIFHLIFTLLIDEPSVALASNLVPRATTEFHFLYVDCFCVVFFSSFFHILFHFYSFDWRAICSIGRQVSSKSNSNRVSYFVSWLLVYFFRLFLISFQFFWLTIHLWHWQASLCLRFDNSWGWIMIIWEINQTFEHSDHLKDLE